MLPEVDYLVRATQELRLLMQALDEQLEGALDVELESDILTIEFADGTRYVINSHRAARQIWMAAERTAWHFDCDAENGVWIATKSGQELWAALSEALSSKLGAQTRLQRPAIAPPDR